jgi:hypothetical protein
MAVTVDYCGELYYPLAERPFLVGREADLVLDDENPFLHRVFLSIEQENGLWWLNNVGSALHASVSASNGLFQAWLAPASRLPIVFSHMVVWFTAGDMTYEIEILQDDAPYEPVNPIQPSDGQLTVGGVHLTPDQRVLIVALAEDVLKNMNRGAGAIPTSAAAARRLGWELTKFNRKLDNVCSKLAAMGVRGLHGGPGRLATSRKARLVEYAVGTQIITRADLVLLPGSPSVWKDESHDPTV